MIAMINPCLFYQSNGTMAVIIYFSFIFDENTPENLWATKRIVGEREIGDWFIIMRMVTMMAMAIATV
jgi:hypothetical protein